MLVSSHWSYIFYNEFLILYGTTANLKNFHCIVWTKYQSSTIFQKLLHGNEKLKTLFAVQEILYFALKFIFTSQWKSSEQFYLSIFFAIISQVWS